MGVVGGQRKPAKWWEIALAVAIFMSLSFMAWLSIYGFIVALKGQS